ncbi:MarR family winged helix-turn-helix transcriptional regulator [Fodinicurvata halophila]|uniref:MarR family winged helix-turn-helix transcriptional regulator n=1 Tax=Fodinicurvata halophila TaxID=1419723 RepID=A0ABV8UQ29_9PROT
MTKVRPDTIAAWTSLVSVSGALLERIEEALKSAGLPPLSWYDALLEIEKAEPDGLRPFELKERLLLPQYSTSRLLARIEKAGMIERQSCEDDGRGQVIVLTEAGRTTRQRMWPVYAEQLSHLIEERLPAGERQQLADLLGKLKAPVP